MLLGKGLFGLLILFAPADRALPVRAPGRRLSDQVNHGDQDRKQGTSHILKRLSVFAEVGSARITGSARDNRDTLNLLWRDADGFLPSSRHSTSFFGEGSGRAVSVREEKALAVRELAGAHRTAQRHCPGTKINITGRTGVV